MTEYKLVFTGTTGAGKTTAIAAVSDVTPMATEARNMDASFDKATTTVGMDYGELKLADGETLRLYGTPGQERFDFMWKIIGRGAMGLVILIDNSRPAPLEDFSRYLSGFSDLLRSVPCVVGIGRTEAHPLPGLDAFVRVAARHGVTCPVIAANATRKDDVLQLVDLLLWQLTAHAEVAC